MYVCFAHIIFGSDLPIMQLMQLKMRSDQVNGLLLLSL